MPTEPTPNVLRELARVHREQAEDFRRWRALDIAADCIKRAEACEAEATRLEQTPANVFLERWAEAVVFGFLLADFWLARGLI